MRIVVAGGGSGGHIYPALAIVEAITQKRPDCEVLYLGTSHGMEADLVPRAQIRFHAIHGRGLLVRGIRGKISGLWNAFRGLGEALAVLRRFGPDVVVGTGGYVSGPVGLAAKWLKIPLVIQEQNAWPGFTNRKLGTWAERIIVPFDSSRQYFPEDRVVVMNNPVHIDPRWQRTEARRALEIDEGQVVLLATGGSQGALAINRFLLTHLRQFLEHPQWTLLWATGKRYADEIRARLREFDAYAPKRIRVVEYFYDIQREYRAADVFFGRAGAMTLADCRAMGLPAILVPSPNVAEDHQTHNARALEALGAATVVAESRLAQEGWKVLSKVLEDANLRRAMSVKAHQGFDACSGRAMADMVLAVATQARASQGGKVR